jgi:hypothetical protein
MVDYNMPQVDVWGAFARGRAIGQDMRQERNQRAQGQAFQTGGYNAAAQMAAGQGDVEAMDTYTQRAQQQEESTRTRALQHATILSNMAEYVGAIPESDMEGRLARIQSLTPRLVELGLDEANIREFKPTDANLQGYRALAGQFSRFVNIKEHNGALVGLLPDGSVEELIPADLTQGAPNGYRWTNPSRERVERIPGYVPSTGGGSRITYQPITPEIAEMYGLPNGGEGYAIGNNGLPRRITGGGGALTERQSVASASAIRMQNAEGKLEEVSATRPDQLAGYLEQVPIWGQGMATNRRNVAQRQLDQASAEWSEAFLRATTGAAVTRDEIRLAERIFMPQVGDTQADVQRKAASRAVALQAIQTGLPQAALNAIRQAGGNPSNFPTLEEAAQAGVGGGASGGGGVSLEDMSLEELEALREELANGEQY